MAQWSSRKFLGLTWSGVVAASLLAGCGGDGSMDPNAPMQSQQQQAAEPQEPSGLPAVRLESLEAVPLDTVLSSRTKSLLRARLAEGLAQFHREIPVTDDSGRIVVLRDTGTDGDEKAGDGVFSAVAIVDVTSHMKTQERILAAQRETPDQRITFATFDNREIVSEQPVVALTRDRFQPGIPFPIFPVGLTTAVKPANSLLIRASGVVNDATRTFNPCTNAGNPNGVWTFNHLMTQMANTPSTFISPSDFTEQWLNQWNTPQAVNGWSIPARTQMNTRILNPWPRIGGKLDMTKSPFKLVAIVNRLDLGKGNGPVGYGGSSGAGELRFVFAAVDRSGGGCSISPFLVIFEFGVPINGCFAVQSWAQQWLALSGTGMTPGTAAFNTALENITQQVVVANAAPTKPNGSAINQIRTNENLLAITWQLREFTLSASGPTPNFLAHNTVALTPGDSRNNTTVFRDFVNNNEAAILANSYGVPLTFPSIVTNFLGARPEIPNPATAFWRAPGILNNNARHKASLNTCNGCHGREVQTPNFTHIDQTGILSPFLQAGMVNVNNAFNVSDPVSGVNRQFFEMRDRAQHLDSVANQSCLFRRFDMPMLSAH
jgi:hypothetical protein